MEPMDVIQTEIPEDLLRDILIRTYPKKHILFQVIMNFMMIVCGASILSKVIDVYIKYHFFDIRFKRFTVLGIGIFLWGVYQLIKWVRTPRINTEKWLKNLRIQTGQSNLHLKLQFLGEEVTVCNADIPDDDLLHIPYDYIHTIYIFDAVMVLATRQGRVNIMCKDLPDETEFTRWLIAKCGGVKVRNLN